MNEQYLLQNSLFCTLSSSLNSQNEFSQITYSDITYNAVVLDSQQSDKHLQKEVLSTSETFVPLSILKNDSSLEAIVKYLKDVSNLKFNQIARLLNRDQRTIWVTYSKSKYKSEIKSKSGSGFKLESLNDSNMDNLSNELYLPLSIFLSRRLSVLESVVFYLLNTYSLSFNQISDLIGRHYQTVRTVYNRALKKINTGTETKA